MLFAQITDTHINTLAKSPFKGRSASKQLAAVVDFLNKLKQPPRFVLLTGDCVHEGNLDEYLELQSLLQKLEMPCFIIPGNHDSRTHLRACFPELNRLSPNNPFIQYVLDDYPLRLIALDTVSDGNTYGEFCVNRLQWLEDVLSEAPTRPTVLFMHHPPAIYDFPILDSNANQNTLGLSTLLTRHPQVHSILCGHFHRPCLTLWQNKTVIVASSTVAQFSPDISEERRLEWSDEPPGFALHRWHESRLVTHFCNIPLVL